MGRSLFGLGSRDDMVVEPFGRSVSQSVPLGTGSGKYDRSKHARWGRDARGRYRRRVASADVLLLLLGRLGRGVSGFRRGRDVLLVVRHRGARRGLHRARFAFRARITVGGRVSSEAPRGDDRDVGERVAGARSVAPGRGAASSRDERRARGALSRRRGGRTRAWVCASSARDFRKPRKYTGGTQRPFVRDQKFTVFFFRGFRKSRATLGIHDSSHQKWHRNERNAPMTRRRSTAFMMITRVVHSHASTAPPPRPPPSSRRRCAHPPAPSRGARRGSSRGPRPRATPPPPPRRPARPRARTRTQPPRSRTTAAPPTARRPSDASRPRCRKAAEET